jgi:glycosyltransferase involved in cell wall biosynthesis
LSPTVPRDVDGPQTIALVTPNFNTSAYLAQTLESVLCQHYPALEYVVVDGGSTDGSIEIVERSADRLHAAIIEPDRGHADALNKGFARTSGGIMGWINSDDLLHRNALATVDAVFAAFPQVDWITGIPTTALGGGTEGAVTEFKVKGGRAFTYGDFLAGDFRWLQQESTFWRRSLWERAGGSLDTGFRLAVDFELWMRFFRHARLYTVEALIGAFRRREGQRSAVLLDDYLAEVGAVIEREHDLLRSGAVTVPPESLERSTSGGLRTRIRQRLRPTPRHFDITRVQIETELLRRWAQQTAASG